MVGFFSRIVVTAASSFLWVKELPKKNSLSEDAISPGVKERANKR